MSFKHTHTQKQKATTKIDLREKQNLCDIKVQGQTARSNIEAIASIQKI